MPREWMLDLKEIALAIQAEQNQVTALLQALHGFVARQAEQIASVLQPPPSPSSGPPQSVQEAVKKSEWLRDSHVEDPRSGAPLRYWLPNAVVRFPTIPICSHAHKVECRGAIIRNNREAGSAGCSATS